MKRSTGSKPTAYDKAQIYTLLIGTLGAGANPITTPLPTTPATPQQLEATALSASSIGLEWSSTGENTLTYEIESSPDNATWTQIAATNVGQTTYTDIDLTAVTLYYYRVRAANLTAKSPYSNVASATTLATFPTTGILDNFNRANEGPPPSASWYTPAGGGFSGMKVVSNQCVIASIPDDWGVGGLVTQYGPDVELYCDYIAGNSTSAIRLYIRCNHQNLGWTPGNGYVLECISGIGGTFTQRLYRCTNGVFTTLDTISDFVITPGDSVGISAVGSAIKAYYKASGGSWTEKMSATDATYNNSGYVGVELVTGVDIIDNLGGGTVV